MKNIIRNGKNRLISRRTFLNRTAAGSAVFAFGPVTSFISVNDQKKTNWPDESGRFRFHLIGQAHIDPVWLWPWQEGIAVVHSTFQSALDRMNETPDFAFTASSAQFYQWIAENDPAMLIEIRKRVDEGRWNVVGGWWVEPDVNIPSGEALVRQGLYGQLTLQRLLGRRSTVAFNPDSFGHTGTLPQIIKSQGMDYYVFMRPMKNEKELPSNLFNWEGSDGTRILTYRIPISYNDSGSVRTRVEQVLEQMKGEPVKSFMTYYGAGDHGGGATKENISSIQELQKEKGAPEIIFSTPERFFKELRNDKNLRLPVVKDDLQHHAVGCYTADSEIKKGNRISESALIAAEKITAIGSMVWGAVYPAEELTRAWQRVLFMQFHDSLAGTSVPEHTQAAREAYGYALDIAHQATYIAIQKLEWNVASEDPASQYLLAFNPHAWDTTANIEYDYNWDPKNPSRVEDEKGNPLKHQWTAGSTETGRRKRLIISTPLPPLGYRQIRLMTGNSPETTDRVKADGNTMENEFLRVKVSSSGSVGIFDKVTMNEIFSGGETGCRAVVLNDPSDTWSHDIKSYSEETGQFGNAAVKITEFGPLRTIIRSTSTYGNSFLAIDWILYSGSHALEARITLNWHEKLKMLKFSFPVSVDSPEVTYETPYGYIIRSTNGDEDPGQRWIDLTGKLNNTGYGLTVFNDAKYGYSCAGNDMRISVVRSAVYAHHVPRVLDLNSEHIWQDQGIQTFRMLLLPHAGTWQDAGVSRIAEEFSTPPVVSYQGIHGGKMAKTGSSLSISPQNIIVSAIKKAEKGDDLILRCVETHGKATEGILGLHFMNKTWNGKFRPFEIKSLSINRVTGNIKEVNLLEE